MTCARSFDPRVLLSMRAIAGDTVVLLAERGVRLLAGLVVAVFCARTLGPGDYGLYSYALSLVVLFSFLGQAGLEQILVRELVRRKSAPEATLVAAFCLRALGGLSAAILAVLTASLTSSAKLPVTWLVSLLAVAGVLQASYVLDAWLAAQHAFRSGSLAKTSAVVCAALARVGAVLSASPLLGLALVSIFEAALTGSLLWLVAKRRGLSLPHVLEASDGVEQRRLLQLARPMLVSGLAVAIYVRADVFLLGQLATPRDVGQYSAAASLSEAFYVLPIALMSAAGPRLTALHLHDEAAFRRECSTLVRYCSLAGLAVALSVCALSSWIVTLVYGASFAPSADVLAVHIWSTWMVFISIASEPWYFHQGMQRLYIFKEVIAALTNLLLNLWLIPRYGGIGAAVATVVSYALAGIGCNVLWRETRGLFSLQLRAIFSLANPFRRSFSASPWSGHE